MGRDWEGWSRARRTLYGEGWRGLETERTRKGIEG
jgi:hypothetical protein